MREADGTEAESNLLRLLDALQTSPGQIKADFPGDIQEGVPWWLTDESEFTVVTARKGRKRLLFTSEAEALQQRDGAKPPLIQAHLKLAFRWKARLEARPKLTQMALAREFGRSRVRVTQIMNLLRLAPEIQEYIMAMPPTKGRMPIAENRLRRLVGKPDQESQIQEFERLVAMAGGVYNAKIPAFQAGAWAPVGRTIPFSESPICIRDRRNQ